MNIYRQFIAPILFRIDAEKAHNLAIKILYYFPQLFALFYYKKFYENLAQQLWQREFENPIGLAGGFDKNAVAVAALKNVGFGFVECGTVTPKPQQGNVKPRIFRLKEKSAIINQLGFNNLGIECFLTNIAEQKAKIGNSSLKIGINIGKNKDSINDADDYLELIGRCYFVADYLVVNISSPNTTNLRQIQQAEILDGFISLMVEEKAKIESRNNQVKKTPLLLKVAPDLSLEQQKAVASIAVKYQIDGLIIANTTVDRFNLEVPSYLTKEQFYNGGLSGELLMKKSTEVLANFYRETGGKIPLIAVGGVASAEDAYCKIRHGANLVQIYSAFIYQGFGLVEKIKKQLSLMVERDGFSNISQAVGVDVKK